MTSMAPQWAHADAPAKPPSQAASTTISNLAIPKAAAAQQKAPKQAERKSAQRAPKTQSTPSSDSTPSGGVSTGSTGKNGSTSGSEAPSTSSKTTPSAGVSTGSSGSTASGSTGSTGSTTSGAKVIADLPAQTTKNFSTLGVTWLPGSKDAHAAVQVRTKPVKGSWSSWSTLDNHSDDAPKGATRIGTVPTFVGESDGVQVRVTGAADTSLKDLKVSLIDSPEVASDANPQLMTAQPAAATAAASVPYLYPKPPIISRKGWGADESWRSINGKDCATPRYDKTIEAVVIHHTAGTNSYSKSQSASIVRGIYAYHVKTNGWCDIGYNFLVDRYGQIFDGRYGSVYLPVHGAHATKWNTDTSGISLMGNFQIAKPPAAMITATEKLAAWKLEAFYRNPESKVTLAGKTEYRIFSHGDVMSTECPGKYLHAMLGTIRANVKSRIGSYASPNYNKWQSLGGESGWVGSPYQGEESLPGGGRYTRFAKASIYYRASVGTHYVRGAIRAEHDHLGGVYGLLRYPTSDEMNGKTKGSKVNYFESGRIYWSGSTGAHAVRGAIGHRYKAMGEDSSRLGLPITDEANGPAGSRRQEFAGAATILWSGTTDAWPMWGRIRSRYLGYSSTVQGNLGLPTGMETPSKVKGVYQSFSNGAMYWDTHQAYAVYGDIGRAYRKLGGESSRLGLPTSDEYGVTGGRANNFEHGKITWNAKTRATTITYN